MTRSAMAPTCVFERPVAIVIVIGQRSLAGEIDHDDVFRLGIVEAVEDFLEVSLQASCATASAPAGALAGGTGLWPIRKSD